MNERKQMAIVITSGMNDENSSVAWSIASGGLGSGFEMTVFLAGAGVDWVRKGAADAARLNPLDPPIGDMIRGLMENGANVLVCPPCPKVRGYEQENLLDGVTIVGSAALHEVIQGGASTLCF